MDVQALVTQRSVEGFDEGIICWLAWPRKINPCSMMIGPKINKLAGKLRAVIREQVFWCASQSNEPVENLNNALASQSMPDLDRQSFSFEDIDNRQGAELLTVTEFIVDEVKAPCLIRTLRLDAGFAMDNHLASARPFSAQYQAFFPVKPIIEIATNIPACTSEHNMNTPVAIPNARSNNLMHTQPNCRTRISYA